MNGTVNQIFPRANGAPVDKINITGEDGQFYEAYVDSPTEFRVSGAVTFDTTPGTTGASNLQRRSNWNPYG